MCKLVNKPGEGSGGGGGASVGEGGGVGRACSQDPSPPVPVPLLAAPGRAYEGQPRAPWVDLILDGNEGAGPGAKALEGLRDELPDLFRRYPDAADLEAAIADHLELPDQVDVLVTAGADDALERAISGYLDEDRNLVCTVPTFEMIGRYGELTGGLIRTTPWVDGPYPLERVLELIDADTGVIVVVSPNNPTGNTVEPEVLAALAAAAPRALLVVDLAYTEFADQDLTGTVLELPGAVALRTFSKAWGLAGLRVGYALGARPVLDVLRRVGQPYPVSRPSLAITRWCLQGRGGGSGGGRDCPVSPYVARVKEEREKLVQILSSVGASPLPSQGNFVLSEFNHRAFVHAGLTSLGISVRSFAGKPHLDRCLRITMPGNRDHMDRLVHSFRTVLAPQALLFDMDGVLADVSRSYRQAIKETVARFGVELDDGQISAAKMEPDSNNDWVVCRRLLARFGVQVSLEQVIRVFEQVYSGGDTPGGGLCRLETLIPDSSILERLGARFVLGIVTGRPRRDGERFLKMTRLEGLFQVMVCMEDAPCKPDPAPVRLAMDKLGLTRGWLVGDSPDDMTAARLAGVLPVGFVYGNGESTGDQEGADGRAGEDPVLARVLREAGGATVLTRMEQLELLLP